MHKTDKNLDSFLKNNGFCSYPSQTNKYYNDSGRVIWTEGKWYKDSNSFEWKRLDDGSFADHSK